MSGFRMLSLLLSVFAILYSGVSSQDINHMILEDGEFKNVLIAIDETVQEDPDIINNIKVRVWWNLLVVLKKTPSTHPNNLKLLIF